MVVADDQLGEVLTQESHGIGAVGGLFNHGPLSRLLSSDHRDVSPRLMPQAPTSRAWRALEARAAGAPGRGLTSSAPGGG